MSERALFQSGDLVWHMYRPATSSPVQPIRAVVVRDTHLTKRVTIRSEKHGRGERPWCGVASAVDRKNLRRRGASESPPAGPMEIPGAHVDALQRTALLLHACDPDGLFDPPMIEFAVRRLLGLPPLETE